MCGWVSCVCATAGAKRPRKAQTGPPARDGAAVLNAACERHTRSFGRFGWSARVACAPVAPAYRLHGVEAMGRRSYELLELTPLQPPVAAAALSQSRRSE